MYIELMIELKLELEFELHLPGLGVSVCRGQNVTIVDIVPFMNTAFDI